MLIRAAARIAPQSIRSEWGAEWEAEVVHRWIRDGTDGRNARSQLQILTRSMGAFVHALWLRRYGWRFDMDMLKQDLRYALRGLIRQPMFTAVVVITIGLGIGANSAIFSVVKGVILEPLPYPDPDELVMVWEHNIPRGRDQNVVSPANFIAWREQNTVFENLAAMVEFSATLTGDGEPDRIGAVRTSTSFFSMLGVNAHIGRVFVPGEEEFAAAEVAMLGYGFWRRRFGADPNVIGRSIILNGTAFTVVGVLPPGFAFDLPMTFNSIGSQDVWMPQPFGPRSRQARGRWIQVLGRLKPGVTLHQAQDHMSAMARSLEEEFPDAQSGWSVNVVPLHRQIVGDVETALWIILGAVTLVLLIACANVANLLLSRSATRAPEMALRTALGASRARLIRQLLTESGFLALAGGGLGLLLALGAVKLLRDIGPENLPRLEAVGVDGNVALYTVGLAILTGLLFSVVPSLRSSNQELTRTLNEGSSRSGGSVRHRRMRSGLVVAEMALSLILLVGAGLTVRSFLELINVGVGFDTKDIISAQIHLPGASYSETNQRTHFFDDVLKRVRGLPGVTAASAVTWLPLAGPGTGTNFWVNDRLIPEAGEIPVADIRWVDPEYHTTMRIPLRDRADGPLNVLASEKLAREFWPNTSAIGKTISMPWGDTLVATIVGVVGDVRHNGPSIEPRMTLYWEHQQFQPFNFMSLVVRTEGSRTGLMAALRAEVQRSDPDLPVFRVRSMDSYLADAMAQSRFAMLTLGLFAAIAVVLAAVGIYGVMSYAVSQQTHEIGIRMALGAADRDVVGLVIRNGLLLTGIAVAIGAAGALALARLMEGMVFGISTNDPLTFICVSAFLAAVALFACFLPARRATRVDPLKALKAE